jgi:hypothetical protein
LPDPPTNPSWIDGQFIVIGVEDMVVSHRGEELPFGLNGTFDDRKIMQFLGLTLHYGRSPKRKGVELLDMSDQGRRETGVTRDNKQLRLKVAAGKNLAATWFDVYCCWQEATGRELDLVDGKPPAAEPVPTGK